MALRGGSSRGPTRRSADEMHDARQRARRNAYKGMRRRLSALAAGDEAAWADASDMELASYWWWAMRRVHGDSLEIDVSKSANLLGRLRRRGFGSNDIYDYLVELADRDRWGRAQRKDWRPCDLEWATRPGQLEKVMGDG